MRRDALNTSHGEGRWPGAHGSGERSLLDIFILFYTAVITLALISVMVVVIGLRPGWQRETDEFTFRHRHRDTWWFMASRIYRGEPSVSPWEPRLDAARELQRQRFFAVVSRTPGYTQREFWVADSDYPYMSHCFPASVGEELCWRFWARKESFGDDRKLENAIFFYYGMIVNREVDEHYVDGQVRPLVRSKVSNRL